jgi:hypothetical protein
VIDDFDRCARLGCGHSARAHRTSYDGPGEARGGCAGRHPCPGHGCSASVACGCPGFAVAGPGSPRACDQYDGESGQGATCLTCGLTPAAHE